MFRFSSTPAHLVEVTASHLGEHSIHRVVACPNILSGEVHNVCSIIEEFKANKPDEGQDVECYLRIKTSNWFEIFDLILSILYVLIL